MSSTPRPPADLRDHVVICNCNEKVRRIVAELHGSSQGAPEIVLLVQDEALWRDNPRWHPPAADDGEAPRFYVVHGCATEVEALSRARIAKARAAIILADPRQGQLADPRSTLVAIAIERQNPQVHTVMELISSQNRIHVRSSEVNEIICLGEITEKLIAQSCISPGVKQVFDHLLSSAASTNQLFVLPLPEELAGSSFRQIARLAVERRAPFVVCGYELAPRRPDGGRLARSDDPGLLGGSPHIFVVNPQANVEPGKDTPLQQGDKLVVLAFTRPSLTDALIDPED
jgi:Trk K+ transport system NAD-binding subunit